MHEQGGPIQEKDLRELCRLPLSFRNGSTSWSALVSPYVHHQQQGAASEKLVATYLTQNPDLIEAWLEWSADRRCTPQWFFQRSDRGYELGYYVQGREAERAEYHAHAHAPIACARFIFRVLTE